MQLLDSRADLDPFFTKLSQAREAVLLLDYDGTLAPFRIERDQAFPYPGVREVLSEIAALDNMRLVILTGRPAKEVRPLLGLGHLEIWGCYGWERLWPDGSYQVVRPPEWALQSLDLAYGTLAALACRRLRGMLAIEQQVERKPMGLALHWRGCTPRVIAELRDKVGEEWVALARYTGLELCAFEGGMELRSPGHTKADAVESVIEEAGEEAAVACLGDDLSDEDAFEALKGKGLTALVRPEWRPTVADLWIRPPYGLLEFLWLWEDLCSRPGAQWTETHKSFKSKSNCLL